MITKILLTVLVIVGCYLFLRYKRAAVQQSAPPESTANVADKGAPDMLRWLSVGLLLVSVTAAVGFFIYDWNDSRTLLEVRVLSPQSGEQTIYQVYKGELEARSFTTIQGQQIRVGNSERMEVTRAR